MSSSESDCSFDSFSTAPESADDLPDSPPGYFALENISVESFLRNDLVDGDFFDDISLDDDDDDEEDAGEEEDEEDSEDEDGKRNSEHMDDPLPENDISEGWVKIDLDEDVNYEHIPEDMLAYLRRRDPEHVAFNDGAVHITSEGLNPDPEIADNWVVMGIGRRRPQETYSFERDYPELAPLIRRVVENPASRPAREAMLAALRRAGRLRENAGNTIMPVLGLVRGIGRGLAQIATQTANVVDREYLQELSIKIQENPFWRWD